MDTSTLLDHLLPICLCMSVLPFASGMEDNAYLVQNYALRNSIIGLIQLELSSKYSILCLFQHLILIN